MRMDILRQPLRWFVVVTAICFFSGSDWRQFRGNDNTSVSTETKLPASLDESSSLAWKVPLPGRGPSSPIVVNGRVVLTCSSGVRQDRLHVLCLDAKTGGTIWQRQFWATGRTEIHPIAANAAPTPASDGRLIFAFFSSNDLACFDLEGNLRWFRGLAFESPSTRNDAGMASSPLVVGDVVVVQLQNQGESFAAGIDSEHGETRWRIARDRDAIWSSPTVLRGSVSAQDLVLMQGRSRLTAHDPRTGATVWDCEARCDTIGSVTTCGDSIFLPAVGLVALRADPDRRGAKRLWYEQRLRADNPCPVAYGNRIYLIKPPNILICADAADGKKIWELRLEGPFWATPVLADGRLYCVNHDGRVQVVAVGETGKLLTTSQLDAGILASPAVADGAIYVRSDAHLYKFGVRSGQ